MQTLLLTGGTGYIGSHAAIVLLQAGYNIIIFDNLSNSSEDVIEKINKIVADSFSYGGKDAGKADRGLLNFYKGDLRNKQDLEGVFGENQIDGVIHFAGAKAVGESCDNPFYYYDNNITGSNILFKTMEKYSVRNIIFSSSATVYQPDLEPPFTEKAQTGNTTNPYGTSKFIIENMLRDLSIHKKWNVINLRYFNPVGAHSSGLIGEDPNDIPNNLLPYIMKVASQELESLGVFGDDYNTPDGTGVRDYIHVVDLVKGHLKAWEFITQSTCRGTPCGGPDNNMHTDKQKTGHSQDTPPIESLYEIFNLGTGEGTSVIQMVEYTSEITGKPLPYTILPRRAGDIASSYCIAEKAKKELGWEAKLSVKQAIEDSWKFIQKRSLTQSLP